MSRLSAPVYTRVFSARYSSDKREIASVKDQGTGLERKEVDAIYEQIEVSFNAVQRVLFVTRTRITSISPNAGSF